MFRSPRSKRVSASRAPTKVGTKANTPTATLRTHKPKPSGPTRASTRPLTTVSPLATTRRDSTHSGFPASTARLNAKPVATSTRSILTHTSPTASPANPPPQLSFLPQALNTLGSLPWQTGWVYPQPNANPIQKVTKRHFAAAVPKKTAASKSTASAAARQTAPKTKRALKSEEAPVQAAAAPKKTAASKSTASAAAQQTLPETKRALKSEEASVQAVVSGLRESQLPSETKLDMILDAAPHLTDCFRIIALLNLNENAARAMLMKDAGQFNDEYRSRLDFIAACKPSEKHSRMLLAMDKSTYLTSGLIRDKIAACCDLGLIGDEADQVMELSSQDFRADSTYAGYQANQTLCDAIAACKKNSLHYGKEDSDVKVEVKCPQLGRQRHLHAFHYAKLLDELYPNGKGFDSDCSGHINPYDPGGWENSTLTLFTGYWCSLFDDGEIPELTPDLKLFFSASSIADGAWIQFHGPGTTLYDIDPTFEVYMGSLCDPERKGSFTSIDSFRDFENVPEDGYGDWIEKTRTSEYSVSIKWEW